MTTYKDGYATTWVRDVERFRCNVPGCRFKVTVPVKDWHDVDAATMERLTAAHLTMDAHGATHRSD